MTVLTSKDNPKVRHWTKLASDARYRKAERRALIEGPHLLHALQASGAQAVAVLVTEQALLRSEILGLAGRAPTVVSEAVFRAIVEADNPPGIAAEIAIPEAKPKLGADAVFLEGVQDPSNVGAIMRSAAAFGVGRVVLDRHCADPWSPRALRAGMGGHFGLAIGEADNLSLEIESFQGTVLCAMPSGGTALRDAGLKGALGWIFGAEGPGVSPATARLAKLRVSIPMAPGSESLNVAASAAICFYEAWVSRRAARS
jgi:TrmH family RNA methyltransferase